MVPFCSPARAIPHMWHYFTSTTGTSGIPSTASVPPLAVKLLLSIMLEYTRCNCNESFILHQQSRQQQQQQHELKDRITPHEKLTMYPLFGDLFPLTQRSFLRPRSLLRRPRSLLPRPRVCLYDWIYAAQSERSVNLNSTSMIECNRSRAVRPRPDAARAHLCVS